MILILAGFIEIHTGHTILELMHNIDSGEPLVLDYQEGFLILRVHKLEYASGRKKLHVEILPRYGELESYLNAGKLVLDIA